jgi:hypothetical protein
MKRGFGTLAAALYLATASPAFAHHSHPLTYDWCKSITVEGRVESVEYKNPHSIIVVRQDDGTAYTVDWLPLDWPDPQPHPRVCEGRARVWHPPLGHRCPNPNRRRDPRILPRLQGRGEPEND